MVAIGVMSVGRVGPRGVLSTERPSILMRCAETLLHYGNVSLPNQGNEDVPQTGEDVPQNW